MSRNTYQVHDPSHNFFLAGKLKTDPYFGVKNSSHPVHIQFWQMLGSCPLETTLFLTCTRRGSASLWWSEKVEKKPPAPER